MKVSVVLGTRPEIVKMSPVVRECMRLGLDYFVLHTGQHYSCNIGCVFFEAVGLKVKGAFGSLRINKAFS